MNLYIIEPPGAWYSECEFAIVAAESEDDARHTHPNASMVWNAERRDWYLEQHPHVLAPTCWPKPDKVMVTRIGLANASLPHGLVRAAWSN